jgi:ankyrin repeat protein
MAEHSLPEAPNLEWLRKQAKRRLEELRRTDPGARLADAQFELAKRYGFSSWRALKCNIDSLTVDGQLFDAARQGDAAKLAALLDEHPNKLYAVTRPYELTLLHLAAHGGQPAAFELLLRRGVDVNVRDRGDNAYPMHWAAAGGHVYVVRQLADAGGDVIGSEDDHELQVIGWATCWEGCDDDAHRAVVDFLVSRGARHHIFSAIAVSSAAEVRRIVASDPGALTRPMSRNENHQLPLHFAVRMNRSEMVALLLDLGADPAGRDGLGVSASVYAAAPGVDRAVIETLTRHGGLDVFGALVLGDERAAAHLLEEGGRPRGLLHMLAKRGEVWGVRWLLEHGADPNERWGHWDADVTPLHLAAAEGHADVVRLLLAAGADPTIRDSKHDGDAAGWAESGRVPPAPNRREIVEILAG